MWHTNATATTRASRDKVFARYADVASWPSWDDSVKSVTLDGAFAAGTTGRLIPNGGPPARFTLTAVEPGVGFTTVTRLPGARLTFTHRLTELPDRGTEITHDVTIAGPTTFLFCRLIGRNIAKGLPFAVRELASAAENGDAERAS